MPTIRAIYHKKGTHIIVQGNFFCENNWTRGIKTEYPAKKYWKIKSSRFLETLILCKNLFSLRNIITAFGKGHFLMSFFKRGVGARERRGAFDGSA